MWKRIAITSLVANCLILGGVFAMSWPRRRVEGELVIPRLDLAPAFRPDLANTLLIGIHSESGTTFCRIPTVDNLLVSKENFFGARSARVSVELPLFSAEEPPCGPIATINEGWVAMPK